MPKYDKNTVFKKLHFPSLPPLKLIQMKLLNDIEPQPLFTYFEQICQVPRPSKKEEKIRQFLLDFARENKLIQKLTKLATY